MSTWEDYDTSENQGGSFRRDEYLPDPSKACHFSERNQPNRSAQCLQQPQISTSTDYSRFPTHVKTTEYAERNTRILKLIGHPYSDSPSIARSLNVGLGSIKQCVELLKSILSCTLGVLRQCDVLHRSSIKRIYRAICA